MNHARSAESRGGFVASLTDMVFRARNADGGWSYYPGKRSRIEPTCCALTALSVVGYPVDVSVLKRWPAPSGLLIDTGADVPNVAFNAQVLLAARAAGDLQPWHAIYDGLTAIRGVGFGQSDVVRQDSSLQGWPWRDGTTSWIEPTSWALLALKACRRAWPSASADRVDDRIVQAERLLEDRVCIGGGWNYGNAVVFDAALPPHGAVSALGLLALQDRPQSRAVAASVQYLVRHRLAERSSIALALTAIALGVFGLSRDSVLAAIEAEWAHTRFLDSHHAAALALIACAGDANGYEVYRV
jgi:hypothetical protein